MADDSSPLKLAVDNGDSGTQLPHNIDAEAALLGALLIDNRLVDDVQNVVKADHFFEPTHGRLYDAIINMVANRDMVANPVTLKPLFAKDEGLEALGGISYLVQITDSGVALIGARDFARQIRDLAMLRALVSVGRDMVEKAVDTGADVDPRDQVEEAEVELYRVAEEDGNAGSTKSFAQAAAESVRMAEIALNSGGGVSGYTTGFECLNRQFGGLHKSDLIILAGRPGMGKTALATNIAFNTALRYVRDKEDGIEDSMGAAVAFFSLEMSADQLATRILSEQSRIESSKLRKGAITKDEWRNLARAARELESLPLFIDDTPGLTIASLRTRARRLKRKKGAEIGVIVVDYLQLLSGSAKKSNENRVQEISEISRGLKQLAKELEVPVIALSQLSRQVEQREDKKPQLSDLRESGSIEQDADMVLFVYREDYYHSFTEPPMISETSTPEEREKRSKWEEHNLEIHGHAQVIVAKQRHGATGTVTLHFDREFTKFSDLADDDRAPSY